MTAAVDYSQALLTDASVAAAAFDADLVCRYTNPRFACLGGRARAEGRSLFAVLDMGVAEIGDIRALLDGDIAEVSLDLTAAPGRPPRLGTAGAAPAAWNARLFRTTTPDGGTGIGLLAVDVTPQHRLVEQLRYSATHDRLTGLLNAAGLADELGFSLAQPGAGSRPVLVLFGDLNGFKAVNDRIGHHAGDRVLQVVGQRLRDAVREQDRVARAGGDEFVVLVSGPDSGQSATRVAARLERAVQRPISVDGNRVTVGISIGAVRAQAGDSTDSILQRADAAMRSERFAAVVGRGLAGAGARTPTASVATVAARPGRVGLKRLLPLRAEPARASARPAETVAGTRVEPVPSARHRAEPAVRPAR